MRKSFLFLSILLICILSSGCGYSTRSLSPILASINTLYVEPFENSVDYATERGDKNLYVPMMEVKITNDTVNQFIYDGNLKITKADEADVILKGKLLNYRKDALRYTDNDDVQESRITITVSLVFWDVEEDKAIWTESSFFGESTYFESGSGAKSESAAIADAVKDLAKRIVERTIEDW